MPFPVDLSSTFNPEKGAADHGNTYIRGVIWSPIRIQKLALITGAFLMSIKFLAWWLTNSNGILTDALESIINIVAGSLGLYSLILSSKPRDNNHPYGHGKVEFISGGLEGAMIFMAGGFIIGKAIYNFFYPQHITSVDLGLYLSLGTGLINWVLGWLMESTGKKQRSMVLVSGGLHLQSDAWSSAGLVLGLALIWSTGAVWLDSVVALVMGGFVLWTGFKTVRSSVARIMDEVDLDLITQLVSHLDIHRKPTWVDLHNLRIIQYGATFHIDCHLTLPYYFDLNQAHHEIDEFLHLCRESLGSEVEIFIHTDPCEFSSCALCMHAHCTSRKYPSKGRIAWTAVNSMTNQRHSWEIQQGTGN